MSVTDYPCKGPIYDSQMDAENSMWHVAATGRSIGQLLLEQPYAYTCVEGHWHYDVALTRAQG